MKLTPKCTDCMHYSQTYDQSDRGNQIVLEPWWWGLFCTRHNCAWYFGDAQQQWTLRNGRECSAPITLSFVPLFSTTYGSVIHAGGTIVVCAHDDVMVIDNCVRSISRSPIKRSFPLLLQVSVIKYSTCHLPEIKLLWKSPAPPHSTTKQKSSKPQHLFHANAYSY